jgi:hypothetical protein
MSRVEYLKEQIARCERLARSVMDEITVERLMTFAAQCRKELAVLTPA